MIAGLRTMEHLEPQLAVADVVLLPDDVFDGINQVVPRGSPSTSPTADGDTAMRAAAG